MKLLVTGAAGFIGHSVARTARARGHDVVELVRSSPASAAASPDRMVVAADLRDPSWPWATALDDVDAVIHAAGSVAATPAAAEAMVVATRSVLDAMTARRVDRLLLVSSIAVYDYGRLRQGDVVDERTPLEEAPRHRDHYVRAKLAQEALAAGRAELRTTVLRPGAVYGPGRLWNGGRALQLAPRVGIAIEPCARMKLTYVGNCSEAIVLAAERADAAGAVINIVDDELPTHREFAAALVRHRLDNSRTLVVPYRVVASVARAAWSANRRLLGGRLPLPGLLVPGRLDARFKPLEYSNASAKRLLGWTPRLSLDEALDAIAADRR